VEERDKWSGTRVADPEQLGGRRERGKKDEEDFFHTAISAKK